MRKIFLILLCFLGGVTLAQQSTPGRTPDQVPVNIIFDGSSLTNADGVNALFGMRYPTQMYSALRTAGKKYIFNNISVGGTTTQYLTSTFFDRLPKHAKAGDIIIFWEITNDAHNLTSDTHGQALYNNVVTYCNQARAAGFKVVCLTGIPRDYPAYDDANITQRILRCDSIMRINPSSFCDLLIDPASLSECNEKSDTTNATYYQGDRTHPTTALYDIIALYVYTIFVTIF